MNVKSFPAQKVFMSWKSLISNWRVTSNTKNIPHVVVCKQQDGKACGQCAGERFLVELLISWFLVGGSWKCGREQKLLKTQQEALPVSATVNLSSVYQGREILYQALRLTMQLPWYIVRSITLQEESCFQQKAALKHTSRNPEEPDLPDFLS